MINKYEKVKENKEDKIKKIKDLNYLKNLAFEGINTNQKNGGDRLGTDSSEERTRNRKRVYDNESQLRIGGKIFHMDNQMEQIAKEILNKCKFYTVKKYN